MLTATKGERVVIVGTGETGAIAYEYFNYDSPHEVVAFTAEAQYATDDEWCGLPVVSLDQVAKAYPPDEFRTFVAVSDIQLNRVRRRLYEAVKTLGYDCVSCVSSHAFILRTAEVGENAFIQENCAIQHGVRIGAMAYLSSGTCVGHGSTLGDYVYTGPHVSVCGGCTVHDHAFLGANCCISDCVTVAEDTLIGAGAVVLKDTERAQVYVGAPARPTGRDSYTTAGATVS